MPASREKALENLVKAKILLADAEANLDEERHSTAVIIAYLAMLNAARALLFKDGYREKSHACVARYLEEKCKGRISRDAINLFNRYRSIRHNVQYEGSYLPSSTDAENMVRFAKELIKQVEKII